MAVVPHGPARVREASRSIWAQANGIQKAAAVGINASVDVQDAWTGGDPEMMVRKWSNPMYFADPFGSFGVMWAPGGPSESEGRFNTDEDYAEIWDRFRFSQDVEARKADMVIDLGDRISDIDPDTDLRLQREVAEAFVAVDVPVHHINGNHDRDHLSAADNAEILGQSLQHEARDAGDWQILLWRADSRIQRDGTMRGFVLPEADLLWLSQRIQTATKPTLVVSHVPVSGHPSSTENRQN